MKGKIKILENNKTFFKYIFSSGISFIIDITLFSIFSFLLKNYFDSFAIVFATILARIISSLINYFLNRNKVFKKNDKMADSTTLIKYYALVIIQMIVSATVVMNLYELLSINETIIKVPVEVILFLINYIVQKKLIFVDKKITYNQNFKYHNFVCFALSIVTCLTLLMEIKHSGMDFHKSSFMTITYLTITLGLYVFYKKFLGKFESKIPYRVISLIFSLLMVFGYSYNKVHNASLVFGSSSLLFLSIGKLIGYYFLFSTVIHLFDDVIKNKKITYKKSKIYLCLEKHPFIFSFVFIFVCYLPYIIAFYPVIINYDAANQIKEIMGMHTRYMDSVILLNPNMTLTNFNPLIHTFLIGGCFKIGYLIGNVNFGMFLYSIIQLTIVIGVFAYSIYYMTKRNMNKKLIFIVLLIYSFVPLFPFYAMTAVKDVIFASLLLLFVIKLYDIMKYKQTKWGYVNFGIISFLFILFRNNGIITIVISMFLLLFFKKEIRIPILLVLFTNVFLYMGYNKVLLPSFQIANTSVREVLSVPFQQTARHVKYYEKDISLEDKKIIDKVLGYDDLAERYKPNLSDPVKNKYNKYATDEDLSKYFGVWFKYLLKRPVTYVDATINNVYGYFYPNTGKWYIYTELNQKIPEAGFDYHFNNLGALRDVLSNFGNYFPYIPVVGSIANIGIVVWIHILLVAMLIVNKMKKYILLLIPSLSLILVCILGPANTYFRYILPCVFTLPPTLCILYYEYINKNKVTTRQVNI